MKNKILVIAGVTGILVAVNVTAQQGDQSAPAPTPPVPAINPSQQVTIPRDRTEILARMLNLTDEQKEKVKPIIDEETKKIQELRQQKDLTPQERTAKIREIRETTYQKMKPILTKEQWEKYYRPLLPVTQPQGTTPQQPQPPPAPVQKKQEEKK